MVSPSRSTPSPSTRWPAADKDVLAFTDEFFNLLEAKSHDATYGGYIEYFTPDWKALPANAASPMGGPADLKLMNTHLHLLESVTTYLPGEQAAAGAGAAPGADQHREQRRRAEEPRRLHGQVRPQLDGRGWTTTYARVSYGHDIENIWLLMDACDAAGVSAGPFLDLYKTLFEYSLKYGYDEANGGFFNTRPLQRPR